MEWKTFNQSKEYADEITDYLNNDDTKSEKDKNDEDSIYNYMNMKILKLQQKLVITRHSIRNLKKHNIQKQ